jgi:hypothetical protein
VKHIKLFEEFSEEEMDRILDIYLEKGLDGLTPEEIEYMKSGGVSKIPEAPRTPKWKTQLDDIIKSGRFTKVDPAILDLPVDDFFVLINKIYPIATPENVEAIKNTVRQYIEHDYDRSRGFDFVDNLTKLGKKIGVDRNYRW